MEPPREEVNSKRERSFTHGATTAVRRALVRAALIQPVLPLEFADLPPVLEFGQHLDRQTGAPEHPGDLVIGARADPRVHLVGFEADKSRQRQACRRADAAPRAVLSARRPGKKSECT